MSCGEMIDYLAAVAELGGHARAGTVPHHDSGAEIGLG